MKRIPENDEEFLTQGELCRKLRLSRRTVLERTKDGSLPFVLVGHLKRFHWPTVREALLARPFPKSDAENRES